MTLPTAPSTTTPPTATTLPSLVFPPEVEIPAGLPECFVDAATDKRYGCLITTFAGGDTPTLGDGGPAIDADLAMPEHVYFAEGVLYIADSLHNKIRAVDKSGTITTVAGSGPNRGFSDDGRLATETPLTRPGDILIGPDGLFYFTESKGHSVRRIEADGTITRIAGGSLVDDLIGGDIGDGNYAPFGSELLHPADIVFDEEGNLYIADTSHHRIRKIDPDGIITTVVGTGEAGNTGDGGPGTAATLSNPEGLAIDSDGYLHIAGGQPRIYNLETGIITSSLRYQRGGVSDVAISNGYVYFAFRGGNFIERVPLDGYLAAGPELTDLSDCSVHQGSLEGRFWLSVENGEWYDVDVDGCGHFYIEVAPGAYQVKFWTVGDESSPGEVLGWYTGHGSQVSPDLTAATRVSVDEAVLIEVLLPDVVGSIVGVIASGDPLVAERIAGTGEAGYAGDGGPASAALLNQPGDIEFDDAGALLIADTWNNRVRKVGVDGVITTVAGSEWSADYVGPVAFDATHFNTTTGMTFDAYGRLFVTDYDLNTVRVIEHSGYVRLVAGNGITAISGDGGHPLEASINAPQSPIFDDQGSLFIIDQSNNSQVIRRITPGADGMVDGSADEVITTVVGVPGGFEQRWGTCIESDCGKRGFTTDADGVVGREAILNSPRGIAFLSDGSLVIADWLDHRVFLVTPGVDGIISGADDEMTSIIAGDGVPRLSGMGGPALDAGLDHPWWVGVDSNDNVYVRGISAGQRGCVLRIEGANGDIDVYACWPGIDEASFAVGSDDTIYIADTSRVFRVDPLSREVVAVAGVGTGGWTDVPGGFSGDGGDARVAEFRYVAFIAIDDEGNLYLDDTGNFRIRKVTLVPLGE